MKSYQNFDIELFDYLESSDSERFRVRVSRSPCGEQKISDAEEVVLTRTSRNELNALESRDIKLLERIRLGERLSSLLLPPRVRDFFHRSMQQLGRKDGLRLRIKMDTYALADLPWEFAYIPRPDTPPSQRGREGFLVLDRRISLVRYEVFGDASQPLSPDPSESAEKIRLVAILAQAGGGDLPRLDLKSEQTNLEEALSDEPLFVSDFYSEGTLDGLERALTGNIDIFHFAGHGIFEGELGEKFGTVEGKGFLLLQDNQGRSHRFSAEQLGLNLRGRGVRLAVLGACEAARRDQINAWTGIAPALTRQGLPAVIAMQFSIQDQNAVIFSRRFYQVLATGKSIDEAVTESRLAILNRSQDQERDWGVPVLYLRSEDGVLFPYAATSRSEEGGLYSATYRLNLTLLLVFVALSTFWFYRHLYYWVTESLIAGAVVGLWGTWRLLQSLLQWGGGEETASFARKLLGKEIATRYLGGALIVAILLSLTTSSVYIIGNLQADQKFQISGLPLMENISLDLTRSVAGRPFFLRFKPITVEFMVTSPPVFLPYTVNRFYPWSSVHLQVPEDLQMKRLTVVRIVPGLSVFPHLNRAGQTTPSGPGYELHLSIENRPESREVVPDLRREATVFVGASEDEMRWFLQARGLEESARALRSYLNRAGITEPDEVAALISMWSHGPQVFQNLSVEKHDTLIVEVVRRDTSEIIASSQISLDEMNTDEVRTVTVDRSF